MMTAQSKHLVYLIAMLMMAAIACAPASSDTIVLTPSDDALVEDPLELEIVTLLGYDAIPAILAPAFVDATEAEQWMDADEQVLGLSIDGDNRAYSVRMLSRHEIVNDTVGGVPVAVTW